MFTCSSRLVRWSWWGAAVVGKGSRSLAGALGIAIGKRAHKAYAELFGSPRWLCALNAGAGPQRLLFASTGTRSDIVRRVVRSGAGSAAHGPKENRHSNWLRRTALY